MYVNWILCYPSVLQGVELFVKDVDPRISEQRLFNEFLPFGDIISFKLMMENGRSKGYGYVTYSNEAEAKTAISELNGKILGTKVLFIALSKSKEELARLKNRRNWTRKPCYKKDAKRFWPQRH
ncbi:polyadenylate-binding protein 1-A-like [Hemibagrus wyckioides]|uniref:polyadenylate-binding protein 1-A-like n=1 Tax=Hemibagrus wyckioides TaxID=337641 RepID=UPI00266DB32A|nr:polyadenylate-binding protein 1-A-like [Hemibagrus wyckioides]